RTGFLLRRWTPFPVPVAYGRRSWYGLCNRLGGCIMYQLTSRGELMGGPPSETIHEKPPLIFRIGTSRQQLVTVAILPILAVAPRAAASSGCASLAGQKL